MHSSCNDGARCVDVMWNQWSIHFILEICFSSNKQHKNLQNYDEYRWRRFSTALTSNKVEPDLSTTIIIIMDSNTPHFVLYQGEIGLPVTADSTWFDIVTVPVRLRRDLRDLRSTTSCVIMTTIDVTWQSIVLVSERGGGGGGAGIEVDSSAPELIFFFSIEVIKLLYYCELPRANFAL